MVTGEALEGYVEEMPEVLQQVLNRMHRRLIWAVSTQRDLLAKKQEGLLEYEEEAILRRCDPYIKRLRRQDLRNYTLSALANEGFLPGYGMYEPGIRAVAHRSAGAREQKEDFEIDRPPAIALRELVPGNELQHRFGQQTRLVNVGDVRSDFQQQGKVIGPLDLLIAAHALSTDLVLVTNSVGNPLREPATRSEGNGSPVVLIRCGSRNRRRRGK